MKTRSQSLTKYNLVLLLQFQNNYQGSIKSSNDKESLVMSIKLLYLESGMSDYK